MIGTSSSRRPTLVIALVALAGFVLRVYPFFGADGAWSYKVDYDEGVYFSAASYLLQGVLPYRDFVFAHPPGLVLFLAATSAWTHGFLGVDGAFALARWIAALLGVVNILLVARLTRQLTGHDAAGILAAAMYAFYPELVQVERGPFLEPLLNATCLAMTVCLQLASESGSTYRPAWLTIGGALAGVALSIKVWAAVWVVAALFGLGLLGERRAYVMFLRAAIVVAAVLVLPFALQAPGAFFEQAGLFHLWRPPDGMASRADRLGQIFALRHLASPLLALIFLLRSVRAKSRTTSSPANQERPNSSDVLRSQDVPSVLDSARTDRTDASVGERVVMVAWVLTFAGFLASSAYWAQYNAHLIASEAVLAGLGLAAILQPGPSRRRAFANVVLVGLVLLSLGVSISHAIRRTRGDEQHLALRRSPLKDSPACVFTFEPGWSLAAGRLPPRVEGAPLLLDSYAAQLLDVLRSGQRFPSSADAFAVGALPPLLERCETVILGDRGLRQLSPAALERLRQTHRPRDASGFEAWERL